MAAKRLSPVVGDNGRLFYNYGIGAKYVLEDKGKEYLFEIVDCSYVNGVEYYSVTRNGEPAWNNNTANRIHYLLHFNLIKKLSDGEARELPLTVEEVETFISAERYRRSAAKDSLKNTDYFDKANKLKGIRIDKAFAEIRGETEKLSELEKQEETLVSKMRQILTKKQIEPALVREKTECGICKGSGIIGIDKICDCMLKREKEIKEYNAKLRLSEHTKKVTD